MDNSILGLVFGSGANLLDALTGASGANANPSLGQLLYFSLIYDFIRYEIKVLGFTMMQRASYFAALSAAAIVTMWVFYQGIRIISGKGDSIMALVLNASRVAFIVTAAITMGVSGSAIYDTVGERLPNIITAYVTDSSTTAEEQIDDSLAAMQFALSSIDVINVATDPTIDDDKNRAMYLVAVGTAGPAITAGAMLLFYQVAIALFLGLGPIFILCLIFDQTKAMFQRWLMYGISTMFSLAILAAMISICLKIVIAVAIAHWVQTGVASLFGLNLGSGITSIAMQQGGIGLLMTLLIMTTPSMVGNFFQGTLGQFQAYGQVTGGGATQSPTNQQSRYEASFPQSAQQAVNQGQKAQSAAIQAPNVGASAGPQATQPTTTAAGAPSRGLASTGNPESPAYSPPVNPSNKPNG
jgi:type IV secretion system protein VirB6